MIPNTHITLYNKYIDGREEKYQRTLIRDVGWEATKSVSGSGSGSLASNVASIFIPFAHGANYLKPKAWKNARSGKWTLQEGDVIVKGEVADVITGSVTISTLKNTYDDVVVITSVDAMDYGSPEIRHWEVGAK